MPAPRFAGFPALFLATALLAGSVGAQSERKDEKPPAPGRDCADVSIDYVDVPGLTREERIARMDVALARSLGRFDECQEARASPGGGGGADSLAAGDISGGAAADASGSRGGAGGVDGATDGSTETATAATEPVGRTPEDIPPADNDSVLEAMIRKAATEETDPEVRKRLWNEYRRYKGLPAGDRGRSRRPE